MSGPWTKYRARPDEPNKGPWTKYRKPDTTKDVGKSFVGGLVEGVAGMADAAFSTTPAGMALQGIDAVAGMMGKRSPLPGGRSDLSETASQRTHKPETDAGQWARTAGTMLPNALAPGGLGARVANVAVPTLTTEAAGRTARALGADERGEGMARLAGGLFGAVGASVRPNALRDAGQGAAEILAARARPDANALTLRAQELRASGVRPTLTDVVGDRGRRVIRAVGVRSEEGGEALANRAAEASASAKPAVMARARRMGPRQGESAEEVAASTARVRDEAANANYRPAYEEPVSVTSETLRALSGDAGRRALRQARRTAEARMDEAQVAEIDALLGATPGSPPTQVSAATLDRVRIALREGAEAASRNSQGSYAGGLRDRMGIVDETLDNVPGLQPARAEYAARSQAIDVLGKGRQDAYSTDPGDYRRWLENLSPEAVEANQVALRQELLDTLGSQRAGGFGALDDISTSPYLRENLRAAFGPEEADGLIGEATARLAQARNASYVSPNGGSRTAVLENDVGNTAQDVVGVGRSLARGDLIGLAARAADAWRRRGISPQQAEELARLAVDPNQTDAAIQAITARLDPAARQEFLQLRNAAVVGAGAGMAAFSPEEGERAQPQR